MQNAKQQGFTLTEVLIVIAIIATMMTVAGTSLYYAIPKMRLRSAAQEVYRAMQSAKMEAIKRNRHVAVEFPDLRKCKDLHNHAPIDVEYRIRVWEKKAASTTECSEEKGKPWCVKDKLPLHVAPCDDDGSSPPDGFTNHLIEGDTALAIFGPKGLPLRVKGTPRDGYIRLANIREEEVYVQLDPAGAVRISKIRIMKQ